MARFDDDDQDQRGLGSDTVSTHFFANALFQAMSRANASQSGQTTGPEVASFMDKLTASMKTSFTKLVSDQRPIITPDSPTQAAPPFVTRIVQPLTNAIKEAVEPQDPMSVQADMAALVNPLTGAVQQSFENATPGITREMGQALGDAVKAHPIVTQETFINPLTGAVHHMAATVSETVQDSTSTGLIAALPAFYLGLKESATDWGMAMSDQVGRITTWYREKMNAATERIGERLQEELTNVRQFFTESLYFAPVVFAAGAAAEFQSDMERTARLAGGPLSEGYRTATQAALELTVQQALSQDQVSEMVQIFTAQHAAMVLTVEQYRDMGTAAAELYHVFDLTSGEAALLVSRMILLGLTTTDVKLLNEELFNTGRALGISIDTMKNIQDELPGLGARLGVTSREGLSSLQDGLLVITRYYKELNGLTDQAASQAALEFVNGLSTASEESQKVIGLIAGQLQMSFADTFALLASQPQELIRGRDQYILGSFQTLIASNESLGQMIQEGALQGNLALARQFRINVLEELGLGNQQDIAQVMNRFRTALQAAAQEVGGDLQAVRAQIPQIIEDLSQMAAVDIVGPSRNRYELALESARSTVAQIGGQFVQAGHAAVIAFGQPVIDTILPALQTVLQFVKDTHMWLSQYPRVSDGLLKVVGAVLTVATAVVVGKAVITITSLINSVFGFGAAFKAVFGFGSGSITSIVTWLTTKSWPLLAAAWGKLTAVVTASIPFFLAHPVFAGIAAGALLIGGLVLLEKKFGLLTTGVEKLGEAWDWVWGHIKTGAAWVADVVSALFDRVTQGFWDLINAPKRILKQSIQAVVSILPEWVVNKVGLGDYLATQSTTHPGTPLPTPAPDEAVVGPPAPGATVLPPTQRGPVMPETAPSPESERLMAALTQMQNRRESMFAESTLQSTDAAKDAQVQTASEVSRLIRTLERDMESRDRLRRLTQLLANSGDPAAQQIVTLLAQGDL